MRVYQCYVLNSENDVVSAVEVFCRDDDSAIAAAKSRLGVSAILEVWDAGRRVRRIEPSAPAEFFR